MPRLIILPVFLAFVAWLFSRDRKLRPMTSGALWIPFLWLLVVMSRPVSYWFSAGVRVENPDDYLEGSPFDRNFYLILLVSGIIVLFRRRFNWNTFLTSNRWLVFFFVYCGVSVLWSDYGFVGFKRWIKDVGNIVMVLVVLSETDPTAAIRAMMARCMYVTVPISVMLIKYYGDVGRYLTSTWDSAFCGIATEKNSLGCLALLAGLFLVWDFLQLRATEGKRYDKVDRATRVLLFAMVLWLMHKANSSTALVCLMMGSGLIVLVRSRFARRAIRYLGIVTVSGAIGITLFLVIPGLKESVLDMLGEDITLTGRTDLWAELMEEKINPVLGTGYQSFWLGPRAAVYWEKWSFHPNQAHNGYLQTYLDEGLLGLALLALLLTMTARSLRDRILAGDDIASFLFGCFVVILFYNFTEAMFTKMSPVWFVLILASVTYRRVAARPLPPKVARASRQVVSEPVQS